MTLAMLADHGRMLASGDNDLGAGFIAFVIVMILAVSCFFLFRSMNRHLRKVPATFDTPPGETEEK